MQVTMARYSAMFLLGESLHIFFFLLIRRLGGDPFLLMVLGIEAVIVFVENIHINMRYLKLFNILHLFY